MAFRPAPNRCAVCAKPRARNGPARAGGAPAARIARLWEGEPVTSDVRIRRVLAVAALLAGFGMALPRFLTHGPYPRLGAAIGEGGVVQRVLGPPARGILQPGDQLLTLNGLALADSSVRAGLAADGWPRGPLDLEFEREGVLRRITLPPTRLSPWERFRLSAYPIAVAVLAPLVAFLLVWRRPDLGTAWVFLWYATLDGLGVLRTVFRTRRCRRIRCSRPTCSRTTRSYCSTRRASSTS